MPKISDKKKEERRQLILNVAVEVFSEKGYCSATIDEIVKKAGISKGLIYTYFTSKEEIFLAIAEKWENDAERNDSHLIDIDNNLKPSDKLIIVWDRIVSQWTKQNLMYARIQYEFWLEATKIPELHQMMIERSGKSMRIVEQIIIDSNPTINTAMVVSFSRLWWSIIDGLVVYFISHGTLPDKSEMSRIRKVIKHMCEFLDE